MRRVLQELEGAQAGVGDGRRHAHGGAGHGLPLRWSQRGAGRQLDQLLVAALHAALALAEVADGARAVADHLHLDVARARDELLDVDGAGAEGRVGLGLAARVGLVQLIDRRDHAHAPAAAAGERLDHDLRALAQALEEGPRLGGADGAGGSGQDGTPCSAARARARVLSPSNSSARTDGPTNVMPDSPQRRARRRSRPGSRSRDGRRRSPPPSRRRARPRCRGRRRRPDRSGDGLHRRRARATSRRRPRRRRPPSRCRVPRLRASRGSRFRRGWRSEVCTAA